jgi:hypothetical protein
MHRIIPVCVFAGALAVSAGAQDTTITSKTRVEADDAKIVTLTGCLQSGADSGVFVLNNAKRAKAGDDLEARSKTDIDVDEDETEVKSKTEIDRDDDDKAVGTSGAMTTYELMPKAGVDLTAHVGHSVEITAVKLDAKSATDDDAEVEIETETKVKREDAPDSKVKSETEAELPRGKSPRLTVLSVKQAAGTCSAQ